MKYALKMYIYASFVSDFEFFALKNNGVIKITKQAGGTFTQWVVNDAKNRILTQIRMSYSNIYILYIYIYIYDLRVVF